ncbi:MAG: BlaI/MecI/CopY family transcriptional regulator [Calditrichaeota bacterium]|nr:MAG: BlaI/MecI/CopY family transcriptional regulator [Calditrichota bacterium]
MKTKTKNIPDLSRAEYDVLNILWRKGRQSVREVHDEIARVYSWAYSTTKTTMDRMAQKGLLKRENFHGVFLYVPQVSKPAGMAKWVRFFADRVLQMEMGAVLAMFARSNSLTPKELAELENLLELEADSRVKNNKKK